jgi:hypothetical protein
MYAGAQRVRNRERTGINAFLYSHGSLSIPKTVNGHVDLEAIATSHPGLLVRALTEVQPGWNDVLSFLDVAAPGAIQISEVILQLENLAAEVSTVDLPKIWYAHGAEIAIKFSARNLSGEPARQEYDALKRRLIHLLEEDHVVVTDNPFDARLAKSADAFELFWTTAAKERLIAEGFHPAAKLRVAYDVVEQWGKSGLPGPLIAHSLAAMAGTDLHELVRRGGVRVLSETGEIVWQRLSP